MNATESYQILHEIVVGCLLGASAQVHLTESSNDIIFLVYFFKYEST